MANSQSDSNAFSVRIVSIDHYMAPPIHGLDISYSSFQGGKVNEVPVIRIYGSTPAGQKTCLHIHGLYSALEVEAMVASSALSFASQLGFHRAILESDSLTLASALRNNSTFLYPDGLLMEDIKFYATFFIQLLYSHVKREGNKVAHKLAKHALYISGFSVWMEDVPPPLLPVVLEDIAGFS